MKVTLLTVVVALTSALTIHCSAAADPECKYRQIRKLPMHWANPSDCARFYRCTNKNAKKEVICAADKEYNPKTGKCTTAGKGYCKLSLAEPLDEEGNICENEVSGAYVPQAGHCRDFYICNDNAAYPQSCDAGSQFNATSASCIPDRESECWQNYCLSQADGVFLADKTSCLSFYVCDASDAILQSCDSGSYFNTTENNCQPDVDNSICWENFCLNEADGAKVKNPANCHGFYACNDKIATSQECPEGSYFNWQSNDCELGECPDDETTTDDGCSTDTTTSAPCENCTCPGGYAEGELLPYPGNCMYFYICSGGALVQQSCLEGNFFNATLKVCSPDTEGVCPECSRMNYRRVRRSVEDAEASENLNDIDTDQRPSCLERYYEGEMITHEQCDKYQICIDGELSTHQCGRGSYFDEEFKACIRDVDNSCQVQSESEQQQQEEVAEDSSQEADAPIPNSQEVEAVSKQRNSNEVETFVAQPQPSCMGRYFEGELLAHDDCDKYQICVEGQLYTHSCGNGDYYDIKLNACLEDTENSCKVQQQNQPQAQEVLSPAAVEQVPSAACDTTDTCTCPGGYEAGEILPHPTDCDKYYICENGQLVLHECGQGNMFSSCDKACIPDTEHVCWPDEPGCNGTSPTPNPNMCVSQPNGQLLHDPYDCTAFYQCLNGVPVAGVCNTGDWFNPGLSACEVDSGANCLNPCANTSGILFLPHPDCSKFYFCNNGQAHVEECIAGGFNIEFGVCTLNATCEANMCKGMSDGTTFPVAGDKSKFYACLSGVAVIRNCELNSEYNEQIGVCLTSPSNNCNQTICEPGNVLGAFPTLDGTVNAFCYCRDSAAYEDVCPSDYVFNEDIGVCYSNAPCDPDFCTNAPDYTPSVNRNDTQSFCLCVMKTPLIIDCPNNATFNQYLLRCTLATQDPNCSPTFCLDKPDYTTAPALNTNTGFCLCQDGGSTYHECLDGYTFHPTFGICLESSAELLCDAAECAKGPNTVFPTLDDDPFSFCYCLNTTYPELKNCPMGYKFNPVQLICLPDFCDSTQCLNSANQGVPFPAIDYPYGYCMCNGTNAVLHECDAGTMFDPTILNCTSEVNLECDITLCQVPNKPYPYDVPAADDPYSFCYCLNSTYVELFHCPLGKIYDRNQGICVEEDNTPNPPECDSCTCPGGYAAGSLHPHPQYCNQYYICTGGVLQLQNCGTGNFFNASLGACQPDTTGCCTTSAPSAYSCVGTYREGELIANPNNRQMYYRCQNAKLRQETCSLGYYFDARQATCVPASNTFNWFYKARAANIPTITQEAPTSTDAAEDFSCRESSKRSVPSNCSQYEICQNERWRRRTCPDQRYYNPEQQECLEPRDDTLCNFARVSGLPACNNHTENQTLPHKYASNCAQYYRCMRGKWRLKSCGKREYYSRQIRTCMPTTILANVCQARNVSETAAHAATLGELSALQCQHTAVRPSAANCAKYLMCLESVWWHQFCPLGMYFNSTLNYCMPDSGGVSKCQAIAYSESQPYDQPEFTNTNCTRDGELRPSALACDRYYICVSGQWRQQSCGKPGLFYNITSEACEADVDDICDQLETACHHGERREFPLNCRAYEECENGVWQRRNCEQTSMTYDVVLQECIPNDNGQCSINGLRKACHSGELRAWPIKENCTQFLYCEADNWIPGSCLKGHTYATDLKVCVPHVPDDRCKPMWDNLSNLTTMPFESIDDDGEERVVEMNLPGNDNACLERVDGSAIPHPTDCTRFYLCLNEIPISEQQCAVGSFFDAALSYCRPNDGTCSVPLTGPCANASDGDHLPNPADCLSYYRCSIVNGTQLLHCPKGQYYHEQSKRCQIDHGECQEQSAQHRCAELTEHGTRFPHDVYCNIYYACVRGLAIPIECPNGQQFNPVLARCLDDDEQQCLNGELVNSNETVYSCGNLTDGTYLPNRADCTRYYICSNGHAQPKRCATGAYFDSQQLLCVPDDGSCPFVDEEPNNKPIPPDPTVCEGRHGYMLADPANCNEFYVCINGKLRHERCYTDYFFNATMNQCQPYDGGTSSTTTTTEATTLVTEPTGTTSTSTTTTTTTVSPKARTTQRGQQKCLDSPTNFTDLCSQIPEGGSIAEQGDCRRYISCQDMEPISQRCRNGESYDSLLGFCRQNDGTCLLENGQRVGECNGRHGQLARDAENCRGYFVCINGQKITGECSENEFFDKTTNLCRTDVQMLCSTSPKTSANTADDSTVSCKGLSETVLYPYTPDHCRSYFQCIQGVPKIHECVDGLYFDASITRCVKEIQECTMPGASATQSLPRAPDVTNDPSKKHRCDGAEIGKPYANLDDHCHSYYVCEGPESIVYVTCPEDTLYSTEKRACAPANYAICRI